MVPSIFVRLDGLPLTTSGKVDRRRLPAPEPARPKLDNVYTPPATETEQLVGDIWRKVLQLERAGIHDNFFDLGGHSLRMAQVIALLAERTGKTISMIEAFENPTIHSMARYISGAFAKPDRSGANRAEVRSVSRQRIEHLRNTRQSYRAESDV